MIQTSFDRTVSSFIVLNLVPRDLSLTRAQGHPALELVEKGPGNKAELLPALAKITAD